jgi:hypothetical protein
LAVSKFRETTTCACCAEQSNCRASFELNAARLLAKAFRIRRPPRRSLGAGWLSVGCFLL